MMNVNGPPADLNVSRETSERLNTFVALVKKWNPRINLVSKASLNHIWARHIIDSAQIFRAVKPTDHWVDLGSGGGFPGLVISIMAAEFAPRMRVTLVESDTRKAAFLMTAARETGVTTTVLSERIESLAPQAADIVSARALADLDQLLTYSERHLNPGGTCFFPKGVRWKKEVDDARERWQFELHPITSETEAGAVILKISGVSRV